MSDYSEYRRSVAEASRNTRTIKTNIAQTKSKIEQLKAEITSIEHTHTHDKIRQAEIDREFYVNTVISPVKQEIQEKLELLQSLDMVYPNKVSEIKESIAKERQELLDSYQISDVQKSIDELNLKLSSVLGNRFVRVITDLNGASSIKISENDFPLLLKEYQDSREKISNITKDNRGFVDVTHKVLDKIVGVDLSQIGRYANVLFATALFVALIVTMKYVVPAYFSVMGMIAIYNVRFNNRIKEVLVLQHVMSSNLPRIIEHLEKDFSNKEILELEELAKRLADNKVLIESELRNLEAKKVAMAQKAYSEFKPDAAKSDALVAERIASIRAEIEQSEKFILELSEREIQCKEEEEQAVVKMNAFLSVISDKYLDPSQVKKSLTLDPVYLYDVDERRPVFFTYPESSSLILFNKREPQPIHDFIKLLVYQTRLKLVTNFNKCLIYDPLSSGVEYSSLKLRYMKETKNQPIADRAFRIVYKAEELNDIINEYESLFNQRFELVAGDGCRSVEEFNLKMFELEGVPIDYEFMYIIEPGDLLSNTNLTTLINNGHIAGFKVMVFADMNTFISKGDESIDTLDKFSQVFVVENKEVLSRAKDFIVDLIESTRK